MDDVQSALKGLFADTIQEMVEAEIESSLGYAKHDMKNKRTTNSRNGYSKKTFRSEYEAIEKVFLAKKGTVPPLHGASGTFFAA